MKYLYTSTFYTVDYHLIFRHATVKYLPNDKILDVTKLKAFADDKLKVAKFLSLIENRKDCR